MAASGMIPANVAPTRRDEEIRHTPVLLLTEGEINMLDPDSQAWARRCQANAKAETECPGHEPIGTGTRDEARRGWHPAKCKHCGKDMSVDSGD
jgi:hypothetical protein